MREGGSEREKEGARGWWAHTGSLFFFPFLFLTHKAIFKVMEMSCISSSSHPLDNPFISNTQMNGWVGIEGGLLELRCQGAKAA